MRHDPYFFWRTVAIGLTAIGQTVFVALYVTFPWWRSFLGRALFFKALVFDILLLVGVLGQLADFPGEDPLIVWLYGLVCVGVWGQTLAFIIVMLTQKREDWDR